MSKTNATAQAGRIVWIEPNKIDEISDTGTFDYEDYSICVDLEVRIPRRGACGSEDEVIEFHTTHETEKDRVSFFTGTNGFLTTSFTNITANDPTSNKETLGVSSIDITYNSYFYPQVTIKFVDVRGSSLMYPQEDGFKNRTQGSFFKSLFCFPYPQFILKVKGFYGKQVQYELAVEDFRSAFNSETGNFECTVKFIGYMYGIYADLPMSYLIVAPYAEIIGTDGQITGSKYWEQQVNNHVFEYDNHKPIHKFYELKNVISEAETRVSNVLTNDNLSRKKADLEKELDLLTNIDICLNEWIRAMSRNATPYKNSDKEIVFYSQDSFTSKDTIYRQWYTLNEKIRDYNYLTTKESEIGFISDISGTTKNEIQEGVKRAGYTPNTKTIQAKFYETVSNFANNIKDNNIKTEIENTNALYGLIFTHKNIIGYLQDRSDRIKKEIENVSKEIEKKRQTIFSEILGFNPTIENIFRIIFAHMDTFVQSYYTILDCIKNKGKISRRTPNSFELNNDNSDITGKENFIPPYPLITKKDGSNQKEVIWPGSYTPAVSNEMDEIRYVEGLFRGINNVEAESESTSGYEGFSTLSLKLMYDSNYTSDTTSSVNIIPNSLSDLCFFKNPYVHFSLRNNISKEAIFSTLALRLLDDIRLINEKTIINPKTKGYIEAINFYKAVQKLNELDSRQLEFVNILKSNNRTEYVNEFINYLRDNSVKYHGDINILEDAFSECPVNFENVANIFSNRNYFPELSFNITDPVSIKSLSFFFDAYHRVINNCNIPEVNLSDYRNFWDESILLPNGKKISITSSEEANEIKNDIIKSLIVGSFKGYFWGKNDIANGISGYNNSPFFNGMYIDSNDVNEIDYSMGAIPPNSFFKKDGGRPTIYGRDIQSSYEAALKCEDFGQHVTDPSFFKGASLFGSKAFYAQNSDLARAYLFLEACAPLAQAEMDFNKVSIVTEWTILLWGARLWRMQNGEEKIKAIEGYQLPDIDIPLQTYIETKTQMQSITNYGPNTITNKQKINIAGLGTKKSDYQMNKFDVSKFSEKDKVALIDRFIKWVGEDFKKINNELILKTSDNGIMSVEDINILNQLCDIFKSKTEIEVQRIKSSLKKYNNCVLKNKIDDLKGEKIFFKDLLKLLLHKTTYDKYCGITYGDEGVYLFIKPVKQGYSQALFNEKLRDNIRVYSPIKTRINNTENYFRDSFTSFCEHLYNLYTENNGFVNNLNLNETSLLTTLTQNEDLKLSLYLTLKNLYDRWFCGLDRKRWKFEYYTGGSEVRNFDALSDNQKLCEFNKFYFIDSFYNNIGGQIMLDLGTLKELINSIITNRVGDSEVAPNGMKFQGMAVYQFMASILQKNSMNFLAVPCFNTYKNVEDIKELFTPYSWFDRGEPKGTSYVGLYPHNVSTCLNMGDDDEYGYPNDGYDLADTNGDFKDIEIPDLLDTTRGYTMPAFGVTYGKQDQSYFKKVTVNMDNPQVTEFSIGATLDIANRFGEVQKANTFIGQDLYKVYSNHSYTCTVEMMGNAMITPLMYFQLNNIPMFKGAYMVIKVEHSIVQGNMTTIFTGVRMSKHKIPFVSPIIETNTLLDTMDSSIGNDTSLNGTISNDTISTTMIDNLNKKVDIDRFVDAAIMALNKGIKEEPKGSNRVPELIELPVQGFDKDYAWCAIFVGWCSEVAGLNPDIINGTGWYKGKNWKHSYNAQCNAIYEYYRKINSVFLMTEENKTNNPPQKGDLILFKKTSEYESNNKFGHVGIIENYNPESDKITYIHGNYGDKVTRSTKNFTDTTIGCYARPPFNGKPSITEGNTIQDPINNSDSKQVEINDDDIILRSLTEKIMFTNAVIWQESNNKHNAIGDTKTKYPAHGILQIRKMMFDESNRLKNKAKDFALGTPISGNGDNACLSGLSREQQVEIFIAVMEWVNAKNRNETYIMSSLYERTPEAIPWSMKDCAAMWNGGKVSKKESTKKYFKGVKEKYMILSKDSSKMPPPIDSSEWLPDYVFYDFFS